MRSECVYPHGFLAFFLLDGSEPLAIASWIKQKKIDLPPNLKRTELAPHSKGNCFNLSGAYHLYIGRTNPYGREEEEMMGTGRTYTFLRDILQKDRQNERRKIRYKEVFLSVAAVTAHSQLKIARRSGHVATGISWVKTVSGPVRLKR